MAKTAGMLEMPAGVTASLIAALLLLLRDLLPGWKGLPPTVADILALAGAGKSQAYAMRDRLRELLGTLMGRPGRPASGQSPPGAREAVLSAVLEYSFAHPGAVCAAGERRTYSDDFRRFVVGLTAAGQPAEGMAIHELASVCHVPVGTLKDWFRPQEAPVERAASDGPLLDGGDGEEATAAGERADSAGVQPTRGEVLPGQDPLLFATIRGTHLAVIVRHWPTWKGTFTVFCQMLRTEQRLSCGDTFIGSCLQTLGLRHRRPQRPVEAPWSSGTFRSLFPGAQWLGDGTRIAVRWGRQVFVFNVEALLDVGSDAQVGFRVSDSEDEEALRLAYEAGLTTAGSPPLFLTLDNRPSNHSPGALEAVKGTTILPSTPGRGQSKAPLEGAFGLFQQAIPPLVVDGASAREMARCVLELVMTAWMRGRNGKPRKRLHGRSPAEAYLSARPTQEELDEAIAWIREQQRRQELARRTREARRDPVRLELLTRGLADLGIPDPERRLAIKLAYYSREAIVRGLSTFRTKLELGTLPAGADHGRYLGGIIRQLHTRIELELVAVHLLEQRIRLHDVTLAPLTRQAEQLRADTPAAALPQAFVDLALTATWEVDFRYWAQAAADALSALPAPQRASLYQPLCRRIAASFKTARERRENLIDRMAHAATPAA